MTFSIVAWDPSTHMTGVAVATKHLAVGALVPHARAGVGAIATQAQTNPLLGILGLKLLENHRHLQVNELLDTLLSKEKEKEDRQLHIVDRYGNTAAWTGYNCIDWAGHRTYQNFSVAGNMLVSEAPLTAMAEAFNSATHLPFCERLVQALEAGDTTGGDKRGRQSAALYVVHEDDYPHLDLRVDHHPDPIATLRLLYDEAQKDYYRSFRQAMPSRRGLPMSLSQMAL
ncbi:DUF1028 domain-containing protein [Romeria aff. gracilis LEGE 07310]|uniref:DUF1028 domain-containing protein n=1 Tax=Vasconcelosia minhoensis LEGE 07310 TaxID=915328 RepID=A0A8J7DBF8_9CYAN|nr:DUF1028 domain-containing protein [Romeria gracilis]MBE9076358.1 DUF1028 domain-containing protein [Romeria aff. gracilis LEGE 07310]